MLSIAALCGCHASHDELVVDSSTDVAAVDVAPDALWVSAWNAPTGAAIDGATLADGWQDLRALSSPLEIANGWTDSLFAMPNGKHLLFAYEQTDFYEFLNGTSVITGPPLAGLSPPTFKIFQADLGETDWRVSAHPINSPDPSVVEGSPAANASGDLIVFTEFTLPSGHAQLYYASNTGGTWSTPAALPINSVNCNDDNAKIVGEMSTGVTIYFESTRGDLAGTGATSAKRQLYTTTYANKAFSPIAAVPGIAVAGSDDSQPFPTLDQNTLYWTGVRDSYGIYTATRANGIYGSIHPIVTPTLVPPVSGKVVFIGEASVVDVPEGSLLYMMCAVAMNTHDAMTYHDADYIQLMPCVARRPN